MSFFTKLTQIVTSKTSSSTLAAVAKVASPSSSPQSKAVARERLSVILASQRGSELLSSIDMNLLQKDVLEVVQRHLRVVENSPVNCNVKNEGDVNLFEMSVEIDSFSSANSKGRRSNSIRPARITLQAS